MHRRSDTLRSSGRTFVCHPLSLSRLPARVRNGARSHHGYAEVPFRVIGETKSYAVKGRSGLGRSESFFQSAGVSLSGRPKWLRMPLLSMLAASTIRPCSSRNSFNSHAIVRLGIKSRHPCKNSIRSRHEITCPTHRPGQASRELAPRNRFVSRRYIDTILRVGEKRHGARGQW